MPTRLGLVENGFRAVPRVPERHGVRSLRTRPPKCYPGLNHAEISAVIGRWAANGKGRIRLRRIIAQVVSDKRLAEQSQAPLANRLNGPLLSLVIKGRGSCGAQAAGSRERMRDEG